MNDQNRPLGPEDTLTQTKGCRHSTPRICKNNPTPDKCAFVREDDLCLLPPRSWKRIFRNLSGEGST